MVKNYLQLILKFSKVVCVSLMLLPVFSVQAESWIKITGEKELKTLYADVVQEGALTNKVKWRTEYCADGTGSLSAWGQSFPRTWQVKDEDTLCVTSDEGSKVECFQYEKNSVQSGVYRATDIITKQVWVFSILKESPSSCSTKPADISTAAIKPEATAKADAGPSAAEMAKKLANPSLAIGQMTSHFTTSQFRGTLPGASEQDNFVYQFQPSLPFPVGSDGKAILFRPAVSVFFDQPVFDSVTNSFEEQSLEIGDIPFDLVYGGTSKSGFVLSYGIAGSIPAATSDKVGSDQWKLGPEILAGQVFDWGILGLLLNHQVDVAGDNQKETNVTAGQYFYGIDMGDGLYFTSGPTFSYDHEASSGNKLTFPVGFGFSKTTKVSNRIWKFQVQYFYYVESPDVFGPQHQIRLSITPVVELPW